MLENTLFRSVFSNPCTQTQLMTKPTLYSTQLIVIGEGPGSFVFDWNWLIIIIARSTSWNFLYCAKNSKVFFTTPLIEKRCGKKTFEFLEKDSKFHEVDLPIMTQIGMFRPIRMDHTNCLQVAIKSIQIQIVNFNTNTKLPHTRASSIKS